MRAKFWLLIGTLFLLFVALGFYIWASALTDSLFEFRSPLADNPPKPKEPISAPLTSRLVIIVVDALRQDTSLDSEVMPFLAELRQQGAWAAMHSIPPSYSAPSWTTILTGAWPYINDGQALNPPDYDSVRTFTQDDIFSAAERAGLNTGLAGHAWYEAMLANSGLDKASFARAIDHNADLEILAHAKKWADLGELQLILLHLDQVDYAGHYQGGPLAQNWQDAASRVDSLIEQMVSCLDLSQDTVIVVSDHGHIDRGGHGGQDRITLIGPFIMAGAGVVAGQYPDIQMVDIAPTVAALLGTSLPASNQGRVLTRMLNLKEEQKDLITEALSSQKFHLFLTYAAAIGQNPAQHSGTSSDFDIQPVRQQRLSQERLLRSPIALALALLPAIILYRRRNQNLLWYLGGAVLYLVVFNILYSLVAGKTYSLSSIYSAMDVISTLGLYSAVSLLIPWLVVMLGTKSFSYPAAPAASRALSLVACTLYLLALPVVWNFYRNGVLVSWTLPEFSSMFLGFLFLLQGLVVSVMGVVLVALSALIAKLVPR